MSLVTPTKQAARQATDHVAGIVEQRASTLGQVSERGAGRTTASVQAKIVSNLGVADQSCVVNEKNGSTNGINIVFYNAHVSPATEVDFTAE